MKNQINRVEFNNIFKIIKTPLIVFDKNYEILFSNESADIITKENSNISDILNDKYLEILSSNINNNFPITISEENYQSYIFSSINAPYKITISPYKNNLFIMECLEVLSNKQEEDIANQLTMSEAISCIVKPLISKDSSISDIVNTIINQAVKLTNCETGIFISSNMFFLDSNEANYRNEKIKITSIGEKINFDNENEQLLNFFCKFKKSEYCNNINENQHKNIVQALIFKRIESYLILPVYIEAQLSCHLVLINSNFKDFHLIAIEKLLQFFKLSLQRKKYEFELKRQANYDIMTKALNRTTGIAMLEKIHELANRHNTAFSIAYIDINNLKHINDTLGHSYGDDLIKAVASCIIKEIRTSDIFIRLGGDEFLIVFHNTNFEKAKIAIDRINKEIDNYNKTQGKPFSIGISVGIVEYSKDRRLSVNQLIEKADKLMYINKKIKKNNTII